MSLIPAVVFPDAPHVVAGWLADEFAARGETAPVHTTRIPNPRPLRFVSITRTGGVLESPVTDAAQLTFACWGSDDVEAGTLAGFARACCFALVDGVRARYLTEVMGPQYLPSPDTVQPRYVFTLRLSLRGVPLPSPST